MLQRDCNHESLECKIANSRECTYCTYVFESILENE